MDPKVPTIRTQNPSQHPKPGSGGQRLCQVYTPRESKCPNSRGLGFRLLTVVQLVFRAYSPTARPLTVGLLSVEPYNPQTLKLRSHYDGLAWVRMRKSSQEPMGVLGCSIAFNITVEARKLEHH